MNRDGSKQYFRIRSLGIGLRTTYLLERNFSEHVGHSWQCKFSLCLQGYQRHLREESIVPHLSTLIATGKVKGTMIMWMQGYNDMKGCYRLKKYGSLLNNIPVRCVPFLPDAGEENPASYSIHYRENEDVGTYRTRSQSLTVLFVSPTNITWVSNTRSEIPNHTSHPSLVPPSSTLASELPFDPG